MENKKTGMVVEEFENGYKLVEWDNTNRQLFTLEPQNKSGHYNIKNAASG